MSEPLACARCGADNRPARRACWRCYAPLPRPAVAPAVTSEIEPIPDQPDLSPETAVTPPVLVDSEPVSVDVDPADALRPEVTVDVLDDAPPVLTGWETPPVSAAEPTGAPEQTIEPDTDDPPEPIETAVWAGSVSQPANDVQPVEDLPADEAPQVAVLTAEWGAPSPDAHSEAVTDDMSVANDPEAGLAVPGAATTTDQPTDLYPDAPGVEAEDPELVQTDPQIAPDDPDWDWPLARLQPTRRQSERTQPGRGRRRSGWRWIWVCLCIAGMAYGYLRLTHYLAPPPVGDSVHDVLSAYRARDWEQIYAMTAWDGAYEYLIYRMHDVPRLAEVLTRVYSTVDEPMHPLWRPMSDWQILSVIEAGSGRTARITVAIRDAYTATPQLTALQMVLRNRRWLLDISTTDPIPMRVLGRIRTEMNN